MRAPIRFPVSIAFLALMTLLLGVAYPLLVTGVAQILFPDKANGSLLVIHGQVRGSRLLAQDFSDPRFFRARPSATGYATIGSGPSNLGPTSAALAQAVATREADWEKAFGTKAPEEMLYASASGLDPDISLEAALDQLPAVASARGLDAAAKAKLEAAIRAMAASVGPLSAPRVNVVELNALLEGGQIPASPSP